MSIFVLLYLVLWQLIGAIALGAWMSVYEKEASAVNAQNPWWAGIFLAISAYNNAGFTLLDAGFLPFQSSYFVLIVVTILSLAGPAAFPVFMRFIIWTMSTLLNTFSKNKEYSVWKEGFDFILRFPRRVYTSMFPSRDTWLFIATFGGFVAVDWILILVLGIGNPTMEAIPLGRRIFISLFEGFCKSASSALLLPALGGFKTNRLFISHSIWRICHRSPFSHVFRCAGSLAGHILHSSISPYHYNAKNECLRRAILGDIRRR